MLSDFYISGVGLPGSNTLSLPHTAPFSLVRWAIFWVCEAG